MRLLPDEHYSPQIARQLRARGHDVAAVAERIDPIGLADDELVRRMTQERHVVLTNNDKDFVPLSSRAALNGDDHLGRFSPPTRACRNPMTPSVV